MLSLKEKTMLGNIPSDWDSKPLKVLLRDHYPGDWGQERGPHMVRVLRSTNLTKDGRLDLEDIAERSLAPKTAELLEPRKNDILLERSGGGPDQPVGRVGFIESDMPDHAFSNFLHLLRPDTDVINPHFLGWVLWRVNQTGRILRLEQQTTQMRNLNFRDYLTMPLPVPHPEEQTAIARILDAVDTAIERTREAVERARELKNATLQQFFFQALGETAYADRPTKALPVGWTLLPTEILLESDPKNGVSPKANSQPPGITTFSIAAIRHGKVDLENKAHLKYAQLPDKVANAYRVREGDVLIVRGNANPDLVGKAAMIARYPDGCIYPDITKRVVFKREGEHIVTPEYAVLAWNHSVVHNQVLRRAKTSNGTLKINNRDVKQIILPVPPPQDQFNIVKLVSIIDRKLDALCRVVNANELLKRSLMHELLTGKVRVNNLILEGIAIP